MQWGAAVKNKPIYLFWSLCLVVLSYFALKQIYPKIVDLDNPKVSGESLQLGIVKLATTQEGKLSSYQIIDNYDHVFGSKEYEDDWCLKSELTDQAHLKAIQIQRDYDRSIGKRDSDLATYSTYDDETMKALRSQGNIIALGMFIAEKEGHPTERSAALKEYLVQGGTYAITKWFINTKHDARMSYLQARINKNKEDATKALRKYIAALSVAKFQAMRGDPTSVLTMGTDFLKDEIAFSIDQTREDWINVNANALFEKYNQERVLRGLPEFEEHPPKVVKNRNAVAFARALKDPETNFPNWVESITKELPCVNKIMARHEHGKLH